MLHERLNKFPAWPKTPRLSKNVAITEKIDGTNGLISIRPVPTLPEDADEWHTSHDGRIYVPNREAPLKQTGDFGHWWEVRAGSRNRWLSAGADNFGFFMWVRKQANGLVKLGAGDHYGEWYGSGIQRGYGLTKGAKRFALFNVGRWRSLTDGQWDTSDGVNPYPYPNAKDVPAVDGLTTVPLLAVLPGTDLTMATDIIIQSMEETGSYASKEDGSRSHFQQPEGVCVFFEATNTYMKAFTRWENK